MAKRWYIVQAYSNFERKVAESIKEGVVSKGLDHLFDDVLVPTEKVVEVRRGRKVDAERKFFPGYVLVRMEMDEETWHLVKDVPRVLGFIGDVTSSAKEDGKPKVQPITDKEADAILQRVQDGVEKPRPKVLFEVGEVVRVIDGPFNDFNAVVEEVNFDKNRLMVAVQIFGRSTPVEIEFEKVEKV